MADAGKPSSLRAMSLDLAGAFALSLNKLELAHSLKTEAIVILRQLGNQSQLAYALLHNGHLLGYAQGDYEKAETVYREALDIFTNLADQEGIAHATGNLASVMLELGDYSTAQSLVYDTLRRYSEHGSQWDLALTIGSAAAVAAAQGHFEHAARLAAASAAHRERIGVSLPDVYKNRFKRVEEVALNELNEEQRSMAWIAGQAMTLAEAVDYALLASAAD